MVSVVMHNVRASFLDIYQFVIIRGDMFLRREVDRSGGVMCSMCRSLITYW